MRSGSSFSPGDIIVNTTDVLHRRTEAGCGWRSMSLALDDFDIACRAITGHEFPEASLTHLVRPSSDLMSGLLNAHARPRCMARTSPDVLASPEVARALEEKLSRLMVRCLTEGNSLERSAGSRRRDRIAAQFEEYLEENRGRALYLTEICAAIGVAERTLRGACEEHFGMGPIRYLTLRRMHLVRRALLGVGLFGNIRHPNCDRARLLGVGALRCRLPGLVWRGALGIVAATRATDPRSSAVARKIRFLCVRPLLSMLPQRSWRTASRGRWACDIMLPNYYPPLPKLHSQSETTAQSCRSGAATPTG